MRTASALIVSLAISLLSTPVAYAQTGLLGESPTVTITMSPQSPRPGDTVILSLESPLLDLAGSSITWYKDGSVIAQGLDVLNATIIAGPLGHATNVSVAVQAADGTSATAAVAIVPTQVDLLVDSDSYVPPFYQGRALPSAGTNIRLQAIPHFKRADGSSVAPTDITYTWKQDDRVLGSLSGRGKSSAILPAATLYGTSDIEVDAMSVDGVLSGRATVALPSTEPLITLYEDSPLLGLTYYRAIGGQSAMNDTEMTFAAVPYFAQARSANDPRLVYGWSVNGSNVAPSASDPSEITLNTTHSNGTATLGLEVTHTTNIYMDSKGSWGIMLGGQSSSGFNGTSNGTKDPFSGQTK